jgi:hypothetical protein
MSELVFGKDIELRHHARLTDTDVRLPKLARTKTMYGNLRAMRRGPPGLGSFSQARLREDLEASIHRAHLGVL